MNPPNAPTVADPSPARPVPAAAESNHRGEPVEAKTPPADDTFLGWTSGDRWFFTVLATLVLIALSIHAVRLSGWGLGPVPVARPAERKYEFQLDVNTATWVEWMQLEGIGEALGRRIVADREINGPFRSVEDVGRVKGIGEAKLAAMRRFLRYSEITAGDHREAAPSEPDVPPTSEP